MLAIERGELDGIVGYSWGVALCSQPVPVVLEIATC